MPVAISHLNIKQKRRIMSTNTATMQCCSDLYQLPLTQLLLGDSFHPGGLTLTKKLAEKTLVNRQSVILDIAAGKGGSAQFLNRQYGAHVLALDLGLKNLQKIPANIKKIQAIQANALTLPIKDNSIDVVFCECALCTFTDRQAVIKEIYRVLKPHGFVAVSDIYLNQPLPQQLNNNISRWLCIGEALTANACQACFEENASNVNEAIKKTPLFEQIRFTDQSQYLLDNIKTIEQKLRKLAFLPLIKQLSSEIKNFPYQQLKQFIIDGGAGYYLLTARKSPLD